MLRDGLLQGDKRRELPKVVVLTGGGSRLAGMEGVFQRAFDAEAVKHGAPRLVGTGSRRAEAPEMASAVGLALFSLDGGTEELAPVAGAVDWKERIRSLKSIFGTRS